MENVQAIHKGDHAQIQKAINDHVIHAINHILARGIKERQDLLITVYENMLGKKTTAQSYVEILSNGIYTMTSQDTPLLTTEELKSFLSTEKGKPFHLNKLKYRPMLTAMVRFFGSVVDGTNKEHLLSPDHTSPGHTLITRCVKPMNTLENGEINNTWQKILRSRVI